MPDTTLRVPATATLPALSLRPWVEADLPSLVEAYRDPAILRASPLPVTSHAEAVEWLETQTRGWATGTRLCFAVVEEQRLVAHVVVKRSDPNGPSAEVGYWTTAAARGRGVAPRALEAVTVWAFETLRTGEPTGRADPAGPPERLDRLELMHQADNTASCRVAEKTGFAYERTLPPEPPFPLEGHLHIKKAPAPVLKRRTG